MKASIAIKSLSPNYSSQVSDSGAPRFVPKCQNVDVKTGESLTDGHIYLRH